MNASQLVANLGNYSLQMAIWILAGLLLARLLRLPRPLPFLQTLLAAAILLPLLQSWGYPIYLEPTAVRPMAFIPNAMLERADLPLPAVRWPIVILLTLGLGVLCRMIWTLLGLIRLQNIRRDATYVEPGLATSHDIGGPVTFGFRRPVILVPPEVMDLPESARRAIFAHERAHIRRNDWLFALGEELILCLFWFHPAVWLLVSQIRLTREQIVDLEASRHADSPEAYAELLVAMTGADLQPYLASAPTFLRRRQLAARVKSLISETPMSKLRSACSYGAMAVAMLTLLSFLPTALPLLGAPQASGSNYTVTGANATQIAQPVYPLAAWEANIEGPVTLDIQLSQNGAVTDARVTGGPAELRNAALTAVLRWQFEPGPSSAQVVINFQRSAMRPDTNYIREIRIASSVPEPTATKLREGLARFKGWPATAEVIATSHQLAPDQLVQFNRNQPPAPAGIVVMVGYPAFPPPPPPANQTPSAPNRIRVGANVQAHNIVQITHPEYPALARQARIQGTVRFDVVIDKEGAVSNITVVAGHPLLIQAAMDSLRGYRYRPTMLNNTPVEVQTQVDVNFTL